MEATMPPPKLVKARVVVEKGVHKCDPLPIEVNGGDTIMWNNEFPITYNPSPFEGNETIVPPFGTSKIQRGLKRKKFAGVVQTPDGPVDLKGEIIVVEPG
jgi:hypothetical protein